MTPCIAPFLLQAASITRLLATADANAAEASAARSALRLAITSQADTDSALNVSVQRARALAETAHLEAGAAALRMPAVLNHDIVIDSFAEHVQVAAGLFAAVTAINSSVTITDDRLFPGLHGFDALVSISGDLEVVKPCPSQHALSLRPLGFRRDMQCLPTTSL